MQALMKHKNIVQVAEQKESVVRQALSNTKTRLTKAKLALKQASKAAHAVDVVIKAATKKSRGEKNTKKTAKSKTKSTKAVDIAEVTPTVNHVENTIAAIHAVAEKRRSQLNIKKGTVGSSVMNTSWERKLPGISDSLRKSLWHKMQRRRLTIVLRPTMSSILSEVQSMARDEASDLSNSSKPNTSTRKVVTGSGKKSSTDLKDNNHTTDLSVRTEQLLLLAMHPEAPSPLPPSVPPFSPSTPWAEPGWQVVLDVPKEEGPSFLQRQRFLPSKPLSLLQTSLLSECSSSPGRQAANMLKPRHLRILMAPLTRILQASAPAEIDPSRSAIQISDCECMAYL